MHVGAASDAAHLHRAERHDDAHCNPTVPPATVAPRALTDQRSANNGLGPRTSVVARSAPFPSACADVNATDLSTPNRPIVPVLATDAPQRRSLACGPCACREVKLRPFSSPRSRHPAWRRSSSQILWRATRSATSGSASAGLFPTTGGARLGPKHSGQAVKPAVEQGYVADAGRTHAASLPSVDAETPTSLSTQGQSDGCSEAFPSPTLVEDLPQRSLRRRRVRSTGACDRSSRSTDRRRTARTKAPRLSASDRLTRGLARRRPYREDATGRDSRHS